MNQAGPWGVQLRGSRLTREVLDFAPVLIVDDNPTKRLALRAVLSSLDLTIVEAESGLAALRCVMEQDFAVILLDVRMPEMDGFETAALIRRRRESEMTPIIFVTAFASDEIGPKARYVEGAVDFMFAPVPPEEVRAKVSVFVNLYYQAATLAAQAREVQNSADQFKLLSDAAPIGIFRTDSEGRYISTNPRWTTFSGIPKNDAIGKDWDSIIAGMLPPGSPLGDPEKDGDGVGQRFELWLPKDSNGQAETGLVASRIVLVTSEPILDSSKEVTGWVGTLADVTAETRAEEEKSRFRSLVQNSRDVIAVIDGSGRCSYVSPGVLQVSGFSPEEVIGSLGFDFIHPSDVELVTAHLKEIVAHPDAMKTVEVRTRTKADGWIWIEIRAANRLEDPAIQGIVLNYHDITERRKAGARLAQSEKLLAEGQELSHLGSFTLDLRTDELTWSDEQFRLLGLEPGSVEPSFDCLHGRIHPDDREEFAKESQASIAAGVADEREFRTLHDDGTVRWLRGKMDVVLEGDTPIRVLGMTHDITELREAEEERVLLLAQQEHLAAELRMLLDSTGEGMYGLDKDGICTFMNAAGAALLGGEADYFVGQDMHKLTHHSHLDGSEYESEDCPIIQVLTTGLPATVSGEWIWRLDGTAFPVDFSAHPTGGDGIDAGAVVAFQDVTLRRSMEEELRQSERLFRGAFDAAQTGISLTLEDGVTYADVNPALCAMLGYTKGELLDLDWQQITHPDDRERSRKEFASLVDGTKDVYYLNKRYVRKDGETIWVEICHVAVRGADGVPMYFVTHANNVTEREKATHEKEKLETRLVQAQKMEAVGQLAGGVAHDFNNILSVILNYAEFASEDLEPGDHRLADIQEISKAGEKAATLVHQLLAFSRKEIVEERVIDLNEVVTGVYRMLSRSLGEDIDLEFVPLEALPPVIADPGRIEQVLLNLAVNARDAMPDGGVLRIAIEVETVSDGSLPPLAPGDYVVITVADSGAGMDEATLGRIFEPFFTTKLRGEGTGMGLSSAHGIIEQAGGSLRVKSKVGVGTTFSIYLPRSGANLVAVPRETVVVQAKGTETILLVEDEVEVRGLVMRILKKQGYDVISYSNGHEALEYCRENLTSIDLLLTDVVMPKMSGKELSERATSICFGLKTLFMSGYTDALIAQRGVLASGENLITKPFKPEKLLLTVRSLLDTKVAS